MSEDLDDGEFWLPSSFLSDDMEFNESKVPGESPSPVESVVSSTETESDEEEYVAGLTRLIAHATLEDDFRDPLHKVHAMAGSPQSTLYLAGSWSGRSLDSNTSRGSSNAPSQVPSPPSTPLNEKEYSWDFLYAAAGIKLNEIGSMYHGKGLLGTPNKPVAVGLSKSSAPLKTADQSCSAALQRCWSDMNRDTSALAMQLQMLKEQQQHQRNWGLQSKMSNSQQIRTVSKAGANVKSSRPLGLPSSAWPPLQRNSINGGMRKVLLANTVTRRESTGTGVFLPRRVGSPSDIKRKSGCSTVLLPAKVVQALNLNIDGVVGATQPSYYLGRLVRDPAPTMNVEPLTFVAPRNGFLPQHRRVIRPEPSAVSNVLHLPQEWTY